AARWRSPLRRPEVRRRIGAFAGTMDFRCARSGVSIIDADEVKPVRRGHRTAGGARARRKRSAEILGAPLALADEGERADHRAHLVVKEGARAGVHPDLLAGTRDVQTIEGLHRRFRLTLGGAEG